VRLRRVMLADLDGSLPDPGPWQAIAEETLRERLAERPGSLAAFVVDRLESTGPTSRAGVPAPTLRHPGYGGWMASRRAGTKAQTWAVQTPRGMAEVELTMPDRAPSALLALGHGAGGGVDAPDLRAVRAAALDAGLAVARITQPYRVAGRRAPAPTPQLDLAWTAVIDELRADGRAPAGVPLIVGGRSSGARVACRTAVALGAAGVVALAFPLHPPGRPERSRADELDGAVPTLVVNGDRDPFGVPPQRPGVTVVTVPGQKHDLRGDLSAVTEAVLGFLHELPT
jgi:hypothetical protein